MRIVRAIAAATIQPTDAIEHTFPTITRRLYRHGTTMYEDDGTTASSLSTGWNAVAPMTWLRLGQYLAAYQTGKRTFMRESGSALVEENFDLAAPLAAGVTVASSATAGSLVAGNTHSYYIVNLNQNTGRRSGPIGPFPVTIAAGQTSADINTMPATPADAQFTHFEIYRTQAGLTVPFLSQTLAVSVAGTLVNDGVADANLFFSQPLPQSAFSDYFVGVPPGSTIRFAIDYKGMILSFAYDGIMYHTEPGTNHRWSANYRFPFSISGFDITGAVEADESLVVATSKEIFIGTGSGVYTGTPPVSDWRFTKVSEDFGVFGPKCLLAVDGAVYGLGPGGVFVIDSGGVRPMKQTVRPDRIISSDIYFSPNTTGVMGAALGFDPRTRFLYAATPIKGTVNSQAAAPSTVVQTYPIDESGKVGYFDMQVSSFVPGGGRRSFVTGGTDHGRAMLACDSYGNLLEIDYGDNDGQADTAAYTVDAVAGAAPTTLATITPDPVPGVMPARGVRVVGLPLDTTKDPVVGTVVSVSGSTFDIADWGDAAAEGTVFYLGGILGWYETGALVLDPADDGGISQRVINAVNTLLHDLTYDELDSLTTANWPHLMVQMRVDGGNWGPRVTVYDGTAFPDPAKVASNLTGKVEAGGKSKGGVTFRLRFLAVVGNRPVRPFAYELAYGNDGGRPPKAGA